MTDVTLEDAQAHLHALVEQAALGAAVCITREGRTVARIIAADGAKRRITADELRALTDAMPAQPEPARQWMRAVRDGERC